MSTLAFQKYQATGNDFIMVDNRLQTFPKEDLSLISRLCDRKFGIGSDGLILIENHPEVDFNMIFFNPDGSQSLCGNGSRCAVSFSHAIGLIKDSQTNFMAYDGLHSASIEGNTISLSMNDVHNVSHELDGIFVDTGSPHQIRFVDDANEIDIIPEGQKVRYHKYYQPAGTNVNFVQKLNDQEVYVRTYERGVENETLSCGTGVTAAAIASHIMDINSPVKVATKGGDLSVSYLRDHLGNFTDIYLCGPAVLVYTGTIEI